jgi:hypothetical protein
MSQKSSTFVQETRERESWLGPTIERTGADGPETEQLLATAAVLRGVAQAIHVPEDAEELSRARAVACLTELSLNRSQPSQVKPPWYLRLGQFMRYVFTLGRRR